MSMEATLCKIFIFFFKTTFFHQSVLLDLLKKYDNTINKLVSPMTFILIIIIII